MSGTIKDKDKKIVCISSGNRCALPDCRRELIEPGKDGDADSIVGEIAHVKGEKPGSARYDANMNDAERNNHKNLMLTCPNCHKKIDDQPKTYTAKKLYEIKKEHEVWLRECTKTEIVNITFVELEVITKYLVSGEHATSDSLDVVPPKEKIKKNKLSGETEALITMGMTQVSQVAQYIDGSPDASFGERLKQGFVKEYERLKKEEKLDGDELFMALFNFASVGSNDFKQKAAGLAVLVYLFEKCEVFEK